MSLSVSSLDADEVLEIVLFLVYRMRVGFSNAGSAPSYPSALNPETPPFNAVRLFDANP